jgi:hypothetical protein
VSTLVTLPSSPYLEFETGTPGQKGVIFAGIAIPDWHINDDGNIYRETHTVNFGYPCLAVLQYTVSIGLASIYNGGSAFLHSTDSASLCIDPLTQELSLQVNLALLGAPSNLSRYGYQVVAILTTQLTGISGTISYPAGAFGPANPTAAQITLMMAVNAYFVDSVAGSGFGQGTSTEVALGKITGVSTQGGNVVANYNIPAPPYNLPLTVLVQPTLDLPLPPSAGFSQTPEPTRITLTTDAPNVSGVNFTYFDSPIK